MTSWVVRLPLFVRMIRKIVMSLVMSWVWIVTSLVLFLYSFDDIPLARFRAGVGSLVRIGVVDYS